MILALALVITLFLTWQTHQQNVDVAQPVNRLSNPVASANHERNIKPVEFELQPRKSEAAVLANIFSIPHKSQETVAHHSFKQQVQAVAPPLPFKYLGSVEEEGQQKVIIDDRGEVVVLKVSDTIDGIYKVTSIERAGSGTRVNFSYLPMNITQTMVVGNGN